jgi:hypothetical protein
MATLNVEASGFAGGAFDGRYVYFAPGRIDGAHAIVARYDTTAGSFDAGGASAFAFFSLSLVSGGAHGFDGCAFDGRYIYFIPNANGIIVRYDTTAAFDATTSWEAWDLPSHVDGGDTSYGGAVFDGRYLYLVPEKGVTLRFDARDPAGPAPFSGSFL